jgi:hypothetical protein
MDQKGAFSEFLIHHMQDNPDDTEVFEEDEEIKKIFERQLSTNTKASSISIDSRRRSSIRSTSSNREEIQKLAKSKLIETEDSQTGSVDWRIYLRYFKSVGGIFIIIIFASNVMNQTFSILSNCKYANS